MSILKGLYIQLWTWVFATFISTNGNANMASWNSKKHFAMQDVVFSIQYLSRASAFTIHQPNSPEKKLTENIHEENEFA